MKYRFVLAALGAAGAVHAQSSVSVYGVLDTGLQHLSSSNGTSLTHLMKTGHVPSRLGFAGTEELGDGLRASCVLEAPLFVDTGSLPPDGRLFGRQAWVGIASARYGELRLGRQFSVMQTALAQYDPDHFSPFSPALVMQLANVEQTSLDNMVTYVSPAVGGLSLQLSGTLGEKASLAPNFANPQIVGTGTARNGTAAMLQYRRGGFGAVLAYQGGGENLTAGGKALQRIFTAGLNYRFDAFEVGSILWRHRNLLPNGSAPTVTAGALGGAWRVVSAVRLNAEVGAAADNGRVYATGAAKATGIQPVSERRRRLQPVEKDDGLCPRRPGHRPERRLQWPADCRIPQRARWRRRSRERRRRRTGARVAPRILNDR